MSKGNVMLEVYSKYNFDVLQINLKSIGKLNISELNENKVTEIINALSSGKQYGNACLSDGHAFEFKLYNNKNKLIETFYVWGDGNRLLPASMDGCYYSISNGIDLRKIIEDETDYMFYNIFL